MGLGMAQACDRVGQTAEPLPQAQLQNLRRQRAAGSTPAQLWLGSEHGTAAPTGTAAADTK